MERGYLHFEGISTERSMARVKTPLPSDGTSSPVSERGEVHDFFHSLFADAGIPVCAYRSSALARRTAACLRFLRVKDLDCARRKIESQPELATAAVSVVLLGVTEFFRDPLVFQHLERELSRHWQSPKRPRRVWSAACSDGRELLSAGMVLRKGGHLEGAELLGTDCRRDAIDVARSGIYPSCALEKVDESWRTNFVSSPAGVSPREPLRRAMQWKQADLLESIEPGPWDLILWRNMAIYLEPASARQVWTNLTDALASDGFLVTGKADTPPAGLPLRKLASCIYQKTSHA